MNECWFQWAREVNDAGKDGVTIRRCFSLQISDDKNMKQTDDLRFVVYIVFVNFY